MIYTLLICGIVYAVLSADSSYRSLKAIPTKGLGQTRPNEKARLYRELQTNIALGIVCLAAIIAMGVLL